MDRKKDGLNEGRNKKREGERGIESKGGIQRVDEI